MLCSNIRLLPGDIRFARVRESIISLYNIAVEKRTILLLPQAKNITPGRVRRRTITFAALGLSPCWAKQAPPYYLNPTAPN